MFGIKEEDLIPIHRVAKMFDPYPPYTPNKLGPWGILFLCCGAFIKENIVWRERVKNSDIFVCSTDLVSALQGLNACTSDEYAIMFSKLIKNWNNSSSAIAFVEERLEEQRGKRSDKALRFLKTYLVLAEMLNRVQDMSREQLLGFDCKTWVSLSTGKAHKYG
jgi:hypothetical protein